MDLKKLRAKLEMKKEELRALANLPMAENRSMTEEEITSFDALEEEIRGIERQIKAFDHAPAGSSNQPAGKDNALEEFRHYLRTGEIRAAAAGNSNNSAPDGKYLNPDAFSNDLFVELTKDSGILSALRSFPVTSDKLQYPTIDDSATGSTTDLKQAKELDQIQARKLTFGNIEIALKTYAVETVISNQLRDDNAVQLEGVIANLASQGIARNASKDAFSAIDNKAVAVPAAAAKYDYADLVKLTGSVAGAYYANARFVMSQATFIELLGLVDANKRPILTMPMENGMAPSIFGKPIIIDDNAGTAIYLGDFSTVVMATNNGTSTMVDPYSLSSNLATKYITSARIGFGALSGKSVAKLTPKP